MAGISRPRGFTGQAVGMIRKRDEIVLPEHFIIRDGLPNEFRVHAYRRLPCLLAYATEIQEFMPEAHEGLLIRLDDKILRLPQIFMRHAEMPVSRGAKAILQGRPYFFRIWSHLNYRRATSAGYHDSSGGGFIDLSAGS